MRITAITVHQLSLPLHKPYYLSGGRLRFEKLDATVVAVDTDAGIVGWGEGCPWGSTYLPGFGKGVRAGIDEIAPSLIGLDPRHLDSVNRAMDLALPGHPYAKSALDIACWDIAGKAAEMPVRDLLGGRAQGPVPIASSISTGTPEEMVGHIEDYRARGYFAHSCKVGADIDMDIKRIEAISEARQPGDIVVFDVNRAWLPHDAIRVMNQTGEAGWGFEQPCETYEECLAVRRTTNRPIMLDECMHTIGDVIRAHRDHACEAINIKIGRVGGLTKARRIRDFCAAAGLRMLIMETGGSVIADTGAVHLAQSTPVDLCHATWLAHDMHGVDAAEGGCRNESGRAAVPEIPGLGVAPRLDMLGEPVARYA